MTDSPTSEAVDIRPQLDSLAEVGVELHALSLTLPADLSYETFERLGGMLGQLHAASKWWLADWIAWGEGTYGERVYQAVSATGLSDHTVRLYAAVAGRVAPDRRRANVPFSVHQEVAALDAEQQERWLALAAEKGYTVKTIRELLRDEGLIVARPQPEWTLDEGGSGDSSVPERPLSSSAHEPASTPDGDVEAGGGAAAAPPPIPRENARFLPHPNAVVLAKRRDALSERVDACEHPPSPEPIDKWERERDALNWALEQLAPELA